MSNSYEAKDIQHLDYFTHIRQYPGMYIGSKDSNGLHHLVKEIISNSVDEYLNGACNRIEITLLDNNGISIVDNGRGIPHGEFKPGISVLQACFGIENTGGKFNNATGESGYNTSGGEHGTGGKAVNALSTKLIVASTRDGETETIEFSKGKFIKRKVTPADKDLHGQAVIFYPDSTVLETVTFDYDRIKNMIQEESFLSSGLTFVLSDYKNNKHDEFYSTNGLYDFINFLKEKDELLTEPIVLKESDKTYNVEIGIGYTSKYDNIVKLFTNNIPQEKGTHLTGFRTAYTAYFNQFAREKKWLKEKDENLTGSDLAEGQILVINFKMIDPVFKGQNKEELSSSEGRTYVQKFTTEGLKDYFQYHEKDIKIIFDKAVAARKARDAAKKARDKTREGNKKKQKALKFDSKLADCFSKDRNKCEIYITEGDSASGTLKVARNNEYQAVMPVRGKILNVEKATLTQIQKNAEIMTMCDAFFGPGDWSIDPKTLRVSYNQVRYGKIIIMSDADVDGAHIKNLFYTFIWNFCPDLISEGYIYAGVPPLYKITLAANKGYKYLKNDDALLEYRNQNQGKKYQVGRMKGLGEMSDEEVEETLMDPNRRIINQIGVEDIEKAKKLFNDLMGEQILPRKRYIKEHSQEAGKYNAE